MQSGLLLENIFRDSKHGAALRHLPSGYEQVKNSSMPGNDPTPATLRPPASKTRSPG